MENNLEENKATLFFMIFFKNGDFRLLYIMRYINLIKEAMIVFLIPSLISWKTRKTPVNLEGRGNMNFCHFVTNSTILINLLPNITTIFQDSRINLRGTKNSNILLLTQSE